MPIDPVTNPTLPSSTLSSSSSWMGLASGLCIGACAGAAAALLLTPRRGSEVRGAIRSYASQGSESVSQLISSGRNLAHDAYCQVTAAIEEGRRAFRTSRASTSGYSSSQPLTASVSDMSDHRFDEPLGG
jgi:gas vesicle protein